MTVPRKELARLANAGLDPVMTSLGLLPKRGALWRAEPPNSLWVWPEVDSKARDPYRGGAFTLEFERSDDGRVEKLGGRCRLGQLLDSTELGRFLFRQNEVVASLTRPPESYAEGIPDFLRPRFWASFEPQTTMAPPDFWMRYTTNDHLVSWFILIEEVLPSVLRRALSLHPHKLYFGETLSWPE